MSFRINLRSFVTLMPFCMLCPCLLAHAQRSVVVTVHLEMVGDIFSV
jgi:hypothetical protein